jgi:uncharacterized membrane protein
MRELHILAGLVALLAGAIALAATKGDAWHRRSGTAFAWAMLFVGASGATIAAFFKPNRVNVVAGTLTFYLVATGLLAVVRSVQQSRRWLLALAAAAGAATVFAWLLAFAASASPDGKIDHIPAGPIFMFAGIGTLALVGDARVLLAGRIEGTRRLARHLWRMGYALWIATTSFFLGQAKFLPAGFRTAHWNLVPVVLVLGVLVYWVLRVGVFTRGLRRPSRGAPATGAGADA